jgi:hypothetical protein
VCTLLILPESVYAGWMAPVRSTLFKPLVRAALARTVGLSLPFAYPSEATTYEVLHAFGKGKDGGGLFAGLARDAKFMIHKSPRIAGPDMRRHCAPTLPKATAL